MRRKYLATVVFSLPLANAFSLANFQPITSGLIPAGCALSYTRQIANCDNDDFSNGCSKDCKKGLKAIGQDVQAACSGLIVNSRSLLGIVQAGGILDALCVKGGGGGGGSPTTTSVRITTTQNPIPNPTTTRPIVQPTTGIALPSTTLRTTTQQPTTGIALPSSTLQTSVQTTLISSSATQIIIPPTTAILIPTNAASLPPIPNRSSSTTSSAAVVTTTQVAAGQGGGRSGGGSPFDIVNPNGASYLERSPLITAMMLGGWALVLFGR